MYRFIAVYKHDYGTRVYNFATPSTAFDGLQWNDRNKVALAKCLGFEFDPSRDDESLTILELPDPVIISENDAAQVWAADDIG